MNVLIFSLVVLVTLPQVFGYRCYTCDSVMGHGVDCEDDLDNIPKISCSTGELCGKYIVKKSDSSKILYRRCVPKNFCDVMNGGNDVVTSCKTCDTDLCNGSFGVVPSVTLSSAMLLSLALVKASNIL